MHHKHINVLQYKHIYQYIPQRGDGVSMATVAYSYTSGHKIPYCYATIIASHCQIVATTVECTGESFATRIKVAVVVLQNALTWQAQDEIKCLLLDNSD